MTSNYVRKKDFKIYTYYLQGLTAEGNFTKKCICRCDPFVSFPFGGINEFYAIIILLMSIRFLFGNRCQVHLEARSREVRRNLHRYLPSTNGSSRY